MKVAMLTHSTKPRGGVVHGLKLAERLHRFGAEVSVYALSRPDDTVASREFFRKIEVPFEIFTFQWDSDLMVRLERMIETYMSHLPRSADIYHTQDCVGGTALARLKSAGALEAPVFRTVHHVDDFAEPRLFEFERRAVQSAEHRFVVSEFWRSALADEYGLDSVVTYNAVDAKEMDALPPRTSTAPTVLFVGGLEARKGLEYLMLAMAEVSRQIPRARLVILAKAGFKGTDERRWFEVLAERAGVAELVEFHESVTQAHLLQMYSDCDLVALPSRMEGWGLSLMEAMVCRKPVVAAEVGGIPELVRNGVEGLLVPAGDTSRLAESIAKLLGDPGLSERMGSAGRERALAFSWDDTARIVLGAYENALSQHFRTRR